MYDRIWITRDGEHIPVSRMDTRHIRNALRMIYRKQRRGWRSEYTERLQLELYIRSVGLSSARRDK